MNVQTTKLPRCSPVSSGLLLLLAAVLYFQPLLRPARSAGGRPGFVVPPPVPAQPAAPVFENDTLNPDTPLAMSHVASICELPNGRLAAAWYSGSKEGARDVAIYFSTRNPGAAGWSHPREIVTRESAQRDLGRHLRKIGNSVLFSDDAGRLYLLFVTIPMGGWSGSSLQFTWSDDEGLSWAPGRHLTLNPFFNLGQLVKNRPVALVDGGWAVPIYQELAGKLGEVLWLRPAAKGWDFTKSRINGGRSGFQPSLAPLSTNAAIAFLRDASGSRRISVARTEDTGTTWSSLTGLSLPNPDSGLTSLRLTDGRMVLVFNDSTVGRNNLRLAVSSDEGRSWTRVATLAEESGAGVSYPYAIQARDGQVHVVYTWKHAQIKHLAFNPAWLTACQLAASK